MIVELRPAGAKLQLVVPLRDGIRFDVRCTAEEWKAFTAEVSVVGALRSVEAGEKEREVAVGAQGRATGTKFVDET